MIIDLAAIGRELKKPIEQIESALKLLDDGNTIPFITRFRKDQTGGLNEEQLLVIKQSVARLRSLAERRAFIAKSIESQGKLTDEITRAIEAADSSRALEDVYLPFKPKKQTLATVAKQNGLEPLATDIFEGREPDRDLASRATDFVRVDKQLNTVDEVILGVGHILAEKFSDNVELRNELRQIINNKGKLTTKLIVVESDTHSKDTKPQPAQDADKSSDPGNLKPVAKESSPKDPAVEQPAVEQPAVEQPAVEQPAVEQPAVEQPAVEQPAVEQPAVEQPAVEQPAVEQPAVEQPAVEQPAAVTANAATTEPATANETAEEPGGSDNLTKANELVETDEDVRQPLSMTSQNELKPQEALQANANAADPKTDVNTEINKPAKRKKKKKKKKVDDPYKEYQDFSYFVTKMPYHKTLAINRGEKNGRLKVKIEFDEDEFLQRANAVLIPEGHPFAQFMQSCVKDSMTRLVIPSVEREIRREITEAAEKHAVRVFAKNLKNLLLQSPVRDYRVLAIDPGYKRGCSVAVIDFGGQVLEHSHIFVVGNDQRKNESKKKLCELVNNHSVNLIAIGNGAACRETEQLVSDLISSDFQDKNLKYAIVNEAGASVYSTSEVGREEMPDVSPAVRSAASIGRRLIDPLSELVKISPANIGVGLYQHDVKAKHLAESLDEVVQFCVNRVGVDVNTASPSLLKYVSGLNQLTARRVYEYRQENGRFKNREQLKQVASFGDATFVQSAGFLRVRGGNNPLDTTAIHPENYPTAEKIFERIGGKTEEVFPIAASRLADECGDSATVPVSTEPISSVDKSLEDNATPATPSNNLVMAPDDKEPTTIQATTVIAASASEPQQPLPTETESSIEKKTELKETPAVVKPPTIAKTSLTPEQTKRRNELVHAIRDLDAHKLAAEIEVGKLMLRDILNSICKPEFDPRSRVNRPVFRSGIIKIDDLKKDMCMDAQVVNVVDFGVFVDIGLGTSCLVHVSQLANHFIRDPHRFFAVGDVLKVWVTEVDAPKRRVMLTAVQPESLRPKRREKPSAKKSFRKSGHQKPTRHRTERPKPRRKPKPVKPITDDMLKGSEPMRSFSDLAQFFDKQSDSDKSKEKS